MDFSPIYILSIIFIATLVRSTFGFGESLIAAPLLVIFLPIKVVVPLSVFVSILIAAFVVVQDRKQIHFKSAKWLIVFFAVLGIPFGLLVLKYGNETLLKSGLGIIIVVYSIYALIT